MPKIGQSVRHQLEESLGGLGNTYQLNELGFQMDGTSDLGSKREPQTVCFAFASEEFSERRVLALKAYSDCRTEIAWFVGTREWFAVTREESTTVEEDLPVAWEIEDIAKEFLRNRGLVPELVMCLEKAQDSFSNIESLIAEYDCFHSEDYEEEGHIVIRVTVSSSQDIAFEDYDTFNEWMLENIADDSLECFVVAVRRRG